MVKNHIPFSQKKKRKFAICSNMDRLGRDYAKSEISWIEKKIL